MISNLIYKLDFELDFEPDFELDFELDFEPDFELDFERGFDLIGQKTTLFSMRALTFIYSRTVADFVITEDSDLALFGCDKGRNIFLKFCLLLGPR